MDPWADEGQADPGPSSWNVATAAPPLASSPTRLRSESGPSDPWAEQSTEDVGLPSGIAGQSVDDHYRPKDSNHADVTTADDDRPDGDQSRSLANTFDPWGGGSAPIAPLSGFSSGEASATRGDEDEERPSYAVTWQHEEADQVGEGHAGNYSSTEVNVRRRDSGDDDAATTGVDAAPLDEDDPWGSGAQARQKREEQAAQELARQMEIIRLQEEAKGKNFDDNEREGTDTTNKMIADHSEQKAVTEEKVDAALPAPATGWRALFSRATTKAAADSSKPDVGDTKSSLDETMKSTDVGDAPRSSISITAPRLWQAPSLRSTGHDRTNSLTSLGSASAAPATKESTAATPTESKNAAALSGPGWEVATKKTAAGSSGFIQNLLGTKDGAQTTSSGSALSRFGQSLHRPPIVSAEDPDPDDDTIDVEETGIEWEAGSAFESNKQSKRQPPPDLLDSDDHLPPVQGSAVTRIFGRWRGKQEETKSEAGISGDDLSWLDSVGGDRQVQSSSKSKVGADDEDWLAFMQGNTDDSVASGQQRPPQEKKPYPQVSAAGGKISIPYVARSHASRQAGPIGPLQPPPRFTASSQQRESLLGVAALSSGASPDLADGTAFGRFDSSPQLGSGAYHDEPESLDDALLRQQDRHNTVGSQIKMPQSQASRQKVGTGGLLSGMAGRSIRPYTFEDDDDGEERAEDDGVGGGWSAFRDAPAYSDEGVTRLQQNKPTKWDEPRRDNPVRSQISSPQSRNSTRPLSASLAHQPPPSRTSTPGSVGSGGGILPPPPPPSSHRVPQTVITASHVPSPPAPTAPARAPPAATFSSPTKKALSQGTTLTNDDLSFFETL